MSTSGPGCRPHPGSPTLRWHSSLPSVVISCVISAVRGALSDVAFSLCASSAVVLFSSSPSILRPPPPALPSRSFTSAGHPQLTAGVSPTGTLLGLDGSSPVMSYMPYNPMGASTPTLGGAAVLADAPVTGFGDWQEWLAEGGDVGMPPALPATLPSDLFGLHTSSSLHAADDRSGVTERCVLLSTGELCSSTSPLPDQWLSSTRDSGAGANDFQSLASGMMTPSASTDVLPLPSPLVTDRRTPQLPTALVREDFSPLTTPARSAASGNAAVAASPLLLAGPEVKTDAVSLVDATPMAPSALVASAFASPLPALVAEAQRPRDDVVAAASAAVAAVSSATATLPVTLASSSTPSTSASRGTKRRRETPTESTPSASEVSQPGLLEASSRVGTDLESLSPVAVAKALDDLVAAGVSPALARRALSGNWEGTTSAKARKMSGEQRTVTLFLRRLRNRISAKKSRLQRQAALAGLSDKAVALYLSAADVHRATKAIAERNVKLRRSVAVLEAQNGALTDLLSVRKASRGGGDARLPRAIAGA